MEEESAIVQLILYRQWRSLSQWVRTVIEEKAPIIGEGNSIRLSPYEHSMIHLYLTKAYPIHAHTATKQLS